MCFHNNIFALQSQQEGRVPQRFRIEQKAPSCFVDFAAKVLAQSKWRHRWQTLQSSFPPVQGDRNALHCLDRSDPWQTTPLWEAAAAACQGSAPCQPAPPKLPRKTMEDELSDIITCPRESQLCNFNCRTVCVGKDLKDHLIPASLPWACPALPLDQAAPGPVQPGLSTFFDSVVAHLISSLLQVWFHPLPVSAHPISCAPWHRCPG